MRSDAGPRRIYRALLRCLPEDLRSRFGDELEDVFALRLGEARSRWARGAVWIRALVDLAHTAVGARLPTHGGPPTRTPRTPLVGSLRSLARDPGFALLAVGTLALGIGASVATFSILYGATLRPLPYPEPDRLVVVWPELNFNNAMVRGVREAVPALESVAGVGRWGLSLSGEGRPLDVQSDRVTPGYLGMLGARPIRGRLLLPEDSEPDAEPVVVVSHRFWRDALGADPGVVGRQIRLDGADATTRTVVGVLEAAFRSPVLEPDVWIPFRDNAALGVGEDNTWFVNDRVARLAPGATIAQAEEQLRRYAADVQRQVPSIIAEEDARLASVQSLQSYLVRSVRTALWVTLAVVGMVLLIACANVANLLLARGEARRHALTVRMALGAGRRGILRLLLVESAVLGALGGFLGTLLGTGLLRVVVGLAPPDFPRLGELGVDPVILGFAVLVTMGATLVAGLAPSLRVSRVDMTAQLGGSRGRAARRRSRVSEALIGVEVALAMVVAVGSGLMLRSLQQLMAVDTGLDGGRVVVMGTAPPAWRYTDDVAFERYYTDVLSRVAAVPGVESVGAINLLPGTSNNWSFPTHVEGVEVAQDEPVPSVNFRVVRPGYFGTVGVPVLRGRAFDESDGFDTEPVALVNQAFVDRFWPDGDPLGRMVRWFSRDAAGHRVVGVVGDVRQHGMGRDAMPELYVVDAQLDWEVSLWIMARIVDGSPPLSHAESLRSALWSVDPDVPISGMNTLERVYGESAASTRFLATILTAFGILSLLLCASGVLGVTSFSVGQRTSEFGVRMALGSTRSRVLGQALGTPLIPGVVGTVVGGGLALWGGRVLEGSLFQVRPTDPVTFAGVAGALLLVALFAALLPAWRASRVDPVRALTHE